jgi:hypothetical protein
MGLLPMGFLIFREEIMRDMENYERIYYHGIS